MINSVKARTPILALILFVFAVGYTVAATNKVVVIPMAGDSQPSGMVSAFNSETCPTGWELYTEANERFILATVVGNFVGGTGGERGHNHRWSEFNYLNEKKWETFDSEGAYVDLYDWTNGLDGDGTGIYPLAPHASDVNSEKMYYTKRESHTPEFIRLLYCEKV